MPIQDFREREHKKGLIGSGVTSISLQKPLKARFDQFVCGQWMLFVIFILACEVYREQGA